MQDTNATWVSQLERALPATLVARLKAINRLRWLTKYRLMRESGFWRVAPLSALAYLLLDPELESYSYELANEDELIDVAAEALAVDPGTIRRYCDEPRADPELGERLTARVRWRPETKRRLPLGPRLLWYVIVRVRKPAVVVETGVLHGLGSLVILRALDQNAAEGFPGRLISVDTDLAAGWLVPPRLRARWTLLHGVSVEVLPDELRGERVAVLFQDTPHAYANQKAEFGLAIARADPPLILVDPDGGRSAALEELSNDHGGTRSLFSPRPRRHFYNPAPTALAVIPALAESLPAAIQKPGSLPGGSVDLQT